MIPNQNMFPKGYEQIVLSSKAQGFTPPEGANVALVQIENGDARWRDDGVDPTPSEGMVLQKSLEGRLFGKDLTKIKFVAAAVAPPEPEIEGASHKKDTKDTKDTKTTREGEARILLNVSYYDAS